MPSKGGKNKVPEGWDEVSPIGKQVPGTPFICFKTPLKPSFGRWPFSMIPINCTVGRLNALHRVKFQELGNRRAGECLSSACYDNRPHPHRQVFLFLSLWLDNLINTLKPTKWQFASELKNCYQVLLASRVGRNRNWSHEAESRWRRAGTFTMARKFQE